MKVNITTATGCLLRDGLTPAVSWTLSPNCIMPVLETRTSPFNYTLPVLEAWTPSANYTLPVGLLEAWTPSLNYTLPVLEAWTPSANYTLPVLEAWTPSLNYTLPVLATIAIVLVCFILVTALGNLLVTIALHRYVLILKFSFELPYLASIDIYLDVWKSYFLNTVQYNQAVWPYDIQEQWEKKVY